VTAETTVLLDIPGLDLPLRLQVHGSADQVVSASLRDNRIWEPFETRLFVDLLKPGDVVVDVGANLGYFSIIAGALVGAAGRVFAFEPDPDNYALVQANIALNEFSDRVAAPIYLFRLLRSAQADGVCRDGRWEHPGGEFVPRRSVPAAPQGHRARGRPGIQCAAFELRPTDDSRLHARLSGLSPRACTEPESSIRHQHRLRTLERG
jgi:hypothetical protein